MVFLEINLAVWNKVFRAFKSYLSFLESKFFALLLSLFSRLIFLSHQTIVIFIIILQKSKPLWFSKDDSLFWRSQPFFYSLPILLKKSFASIAPKKSEKIKIRCFDNQLCWQNHAHYYTIFLKARQESWILNPKYFFQIFLWIFFYPKGSYCQKAGLVTNITWGNWSKLQN